MYFSDIENTSANTRPFCDIGANAKTLDADDQTSLKSGGENIRRDSTFIQIQWRRAAAATSANVVILRSDSGMAWSSRRLRRSTQTIRATDILLIGNLTNGVS